MPSNAAGRVVQSESTLIQHIYRCVEAPDLWLDFMHELVELLDARSARMLFLNRQADTVHNSFVINHDPHFVRQYTDYYVNKCPWRPELAKKPAGSLYSTYFDFSCGQKQFLNSEFYNDWAKPQDIEHGICGTVLKERDQTVQLLVQRTGDAGCFSRPETDAVNRLVPHIQNAIRLTASAEALRAEQRGIAKLANRYALPFALIDAQKQVRFMTPAMERMVGASRGLYLSGDRLQARDPDESARLNRLLSQCLATAAGTGSASGGSIAIKADRADRLGLRLIPFPVHIGNALAPDSGVFVAVLLNSASLRLSLVEELLSTQYQLTERECQLASRLCAGLSLEQIAVQDGVQTSTLRKQLKSVYVKTGTHRQGELIATLLNSFAAERP